MFTKCWATTSAFGPATHQRLVHVGNVMTTAYAGTIGYAGLLWIRRRGGDGRCLLVTHHAFRARVPLSNDPCEGATTKRHSIVADSAGGGRGCECWPLYESKLFKYRLKMIIWHQKNLDWCPEPPLWEQDKNHCFELKLRERTNSHPLPHLKFWIHPCCAMRHCVR